MRSAQQRAARQLETSRELPKNKSLPLVVVCPTGARAPRAVAVLKKLGFENAPRARRRPGRLARRQPAGREVRFCMSDRAAQPFG